MRELDSGPVDQRVDFPLGEFAFDCCDTDRQQRLALRSIAAGAVIENEAAFRSNRKADPPFPGRQLFALAKEERADFLGGEDVVENARTLPLAMITLSPTPVAVRTASSLEGMPPMPRNFTARFAKPISASFHSSTMGISLLCGDLGSPSNSPSTTDKMINSGSVSSPVTMAAS